MLEIQHALAWQVARAVNRTIPISCALEAAVDCRKLAEQVQSALGRPALDNLLRNVIPDTASELSPLHSPFLNLPWQDVFTTNFDTLLERACASVTPNHYDVVTKPVSLRDHGVIPEHTAPSRSVRPFHTTELRREPLSRA